MPFHTKKLKKILFKRKLINFLSPFILALIFFSAFFYFSNSSRGQSVQTADFLARSSQGTWDNVEKVTGEPELAEDGSGDSLYFENSAILKDGRREAILENFENPGFSQIRANQVENPENLEQGDTPVENENTYGTNEEAGTSNLEPTQEIKKNDQETENRIDSSEIQEVSPVGSEEAPKEPSSDPLSISGGFKSFFAPVLNAQDREGIIFQEADIMYSFAIVKKQEQDSSVLIDAQTQENIEEVMDNDKNKDFIVPENKTENTETADEIPQEPVLVPGSEMPDPDGTEETILENNTDGSTNNTPDEEVEGQEENTGGVLDGIKDTIKGILSPGDADAREIDGDSGNISILYSYDGRLWSQADSIEIKEISNLENGGYFSFKAPFIRSFEGYRQSCA